MRDNRTDPPFLSHYAVSLKWKGNGPACWEDFDYANSPAECERLIANARPLFGEEYEFRFYKLPVPRKEE